MLRNHILFIIVALKSKMNAKEDNQINKKYFQYEKRGLVIKHRDIIYEK